MSYATTVLADNPILYFRLEETGTTCVDSSPSGFVGTCHGSVTRAVVSLDRIGTGVAFGGTAADFIDVPDNPALDITGDFTYECWFKYTTLGAPQCLMSKGQQDGSNAGYFMWLDGSGQLIIDNGQIVAGFRSGVIIPHDGVWRHIIFTRAANIYKVYVNGVIAATSGTISTTYQATARNFTIGVHNDAGTMRYPLLAGGQIDEPAVYNTSVSAVRAAAHYAAGTAPTGDVVRFLADTGASVSDVLARAPIHVFVTLRDRGALVSDALRFTNPKPYTPGAIPVGQIELTGTPADVLGDIQPELAASGDVQQPLEAVAEELARIDATAYVIVEKMFPQNADDQFLTLLMWEALLGLPIGGSLGASVSDRRDVVVGVARATRQASGAAWGAILTEILGSSGWSVADGPGPYEITLMALPGSVYTAGQVLAVARRVTPAHILVTTG